MKKISSLLALCICMSVAARSKNMESYFATIKTVNEIIQKISQEISHELIKEPTRSSNSPQNYYEKITAKLQEEVDQMLENKTRDEMTPEEKQVLEMLEAHINQFKAFVEQ